jgi:hypothetical protein
MRVICPVCGLLQQQPANHLYNNLELLMMGIVVPEHVEQAIRSAIKITCCI